MVCGFGSGTYGRILKNGIREMRFISSWMDEGSSRCGVVVFTGKPGRWVPAFAGTTGYKTGMSCLPLTPSLRTQGPSAVQWVNDGLKDWDVLPTSRVVPANAGTQCGAMG
ncbi:hypothetical protein GCM10009552_33310 [Rothia nasimurium]